MKNLPQISQVMSYFVTSLGRPSFWNWWWNDTGSTEVNLGMFTYLFFFRRFYQLPRSTPFSNFYYFLRLFSLITRGRTFLHLSVRLGKLRSRTLICFYSILSVVRELGAPYSYQYTNGNYQQQYWWYDVQYWRVLCLFTNNQISLITFFSHLVKQFCSPFPSAILGSCSDKFDGFWETHYWRQFIFGILELKPSK